MAGTIYPNESNRPTQSHGERKTYESLKRNLPNTWRAWHSLSLNAHAYREAEADFVIASPEYGFVVLEVKAGNISLKDGRWIQNDKPLDRGPLEQASSFAYALCDRIKRETGLDVPFTTMAIFPDVDADFGVLPDNYQSRTIVGSRLPYMIDSLKSALEKINPNRERTPTKHDWVDLIHRLWGETWCTRPSLVSDILGIPVKLTETQIAVLDGLRENRALLIEGGPGTGKSFIAREAARRFAHKGRQVLYLCYTDPLAKWTAFDLKNEARVMTVKKLAAGIIGATPNRDEWNTVSGLAYDRWVDPSTEPSTELLQWLRKENPVILLDETQDLKDDDWMLIHSIAEKGTWWGFADPDQMVLPYAKLEKDLFMARFRLSSSYRAPQDLVNFSTQFKDAQRAENIDLFVNDNIMPLIERSASSGRHLKWTDSIDCATTLARVADEIDLLKNQNFKAHEIAVCSVRGRDEQRAIHNQPQIRNHSYVLADDDRARTSLIADSYIRLKGLERPAIIVTDLHLIEPEKQRDLLTRLYVGVTRAQICVRIVGPKFAQLAQLKKPA